MKFSAQEEYGLRCLIQIGLKGSATIPEISRDEGLSEHHTAKLLSILRKERFLNSTRGHIGGYRLARAPEKIVVGEVLAALGGRLYDEEFCERHSGLLSTCAHSGSCAVKSLWSEVQAAVDHVVSHITLADLIANAQKEAELYKPRNGALLSIPVASGT